MNQWQKSLLTRAGYALFMSFCLSLFRPVYSSFEVATVFLLLLIAFYAVLPVEVPKEEA